MVASSTTRCVCYSISLAVSKQRFNFYVYVNTLTRTNDINEFAIFTWKELIGSFWCFVLCISNRECIGNSTGIPSVCKIRYAFQCQLIFSTIRNYSIIEISEILTVYNIFFFKSSPQYRPIKYKIINLSLCTVSKLQFSSLFFAIRDTLKIYLFSRRYSSERNTRSTSIAWFGSCNRSSEVTLYCIQLYVVL